MKVENENQEGLQVRPSAADSSALRNNMLRLHPSGRLFPPSPILPVSVVGVTC